MTELQKIVVGIRGSKLSQIQTKLLIQELLKQDSSLKEDVFDIKTIKTTEMFIIHIDWTKLVVKGYLSKKLRNKLCQVKLILECIQ